MKNKTLFFIFILLFISIFLNAQVMIQLHSKAVVKSNIIYMKDIASVYSNYANLKRKVEKILISNRGKTDSIDRKTIYIKLINNGINGFKVTGAKQVKILKGKAKISDNLIKSKIEKYIKAQFPFAADLKIVYQKTPDVNLAFGGKIVLQRYGKGFSNSYLLKVMLIKNGKVVKQDFAQVYVKVWAKIPVAKKFIRRGRILSRSDYRWVIREINYGNYDFAKRDSDVIGKKVLYSIGEGNVIRSKVLSSKISIKRGELVKIIINLKGISISTLGKALTSGVKGKIIRVKNLKSKKIVLGKIIGENLVEVSAI